jgi:hypothetical protein
VVLFIAAPLSDDAIYDAACFCKLVAAAIVLAGNLTNDR